MNNTPIFKRRMYFTLLIIVIFLFGLVHRLFVIQIKDSRDFSSHHVDLISNSVDQKTQELIISSGRGSILDRNLDELIEQEKIIAIGVFPFVKKIIDLESIHLLAHIIGINEVDLLRQINEVYNPTFIMDNNKPIEIDESQMRKIDELDLFGIVTIDYVYEEYGDALAKHVIGYLAQAPEEIHTEYQELLDQGILSEDSKIGRSGLQKTFQGILQGINKKIVYYVDRKGNPLKGLDPNNKSEELYPVSIVTTLDKDIQKIAEEQLLKYGIEEGSIVVLDVADGDILAMASTPDIDLENVDPFSTDWNNKAVQITEPGSIFKTVIAIAALEEGISIGENFICEGEYDYKLACHKTHGELTFAEGYIDSCNIVFAEIAKRLGADKIEEYAEKLGVVGTVGWSGEFLEEDVFTQIANEEENRVYHLGTNQNDLGSIIRTAIGQQDVRLSPLAAANLIVTVLNDGKVFEPRLVEKIIYNDGSDYFNFEIHSSDNKVGSKETYQLIKAMMEQVVDNGTGQYLNDATWDLAGKSGTAQTSTQLNNQWFIGYGPTENPEYAIAVLVKEVFTTELLAQKVFKGIMDELAKMS